MKHIKIIFIFLLLSSLSQAYEGFRCIPSLKDTRIQVLLQNDEVQVFVANGMGYDFMPQFDGPSSSFNISFNQMQSEDLKELGESFTFSWPKKLCKVDSTNFTLSCNGEAKNRVKSIKAYGVSTTEVTEKYENEKFEKRKFRFSVEKDNLYFVSLHFNIQNCEKFN